MSICGFVCSSSSLLGWNIIFDSSSYTLRLASTGLFVFLPFCPIPEYKNISFYCKKPNLANIVISKFGINLSEPDTGGNGGCRHFHNGIKGLAANLSVTEEFLCNKIPREAS